MLLEVSRLSVSYAGGIHAIRDVDLQVSEGGFVAVLGNNGAGKSTLLRALAGTLRLHRGAITGGRIQFRGRDLTGARPGVIVRSGLAMVPEGRKVFAGMTVDENLRAGGFASSGPERRRVARSWVEQLFPVLKDRANQHAGLLSGGEQQMLAIGRALMASPRLLVLDEPSLGLAPQLVHRVMMALEEIRAEGTSVLLVEQDAIEALRVATDAVVLDLGQVVMEGSATELRTSDRLRELVLGRPIEITRTRGCSGAAAS